MLRFVLTALLPVCIATGICAQQVIPDISVTLVRHKAAIGISDRDMSEYTVTNAYTSENLGVTHVYLEQRYRDIPVHNGILNLNLRGDRLLSYGNRWITDLQDRAPSHIPGINVQSAVERSALHLGRTFPDAKEIRQEQNSLGQVTRVVLEQGSLSRSDIIAELVWLKGNGENILLCWRVEIHETDAENVWLIFIDAHSGDYVTKDNLVDHCSFGKSQGRNLVDRKMRCEFTACPAPLSLAPDSSYNVFALPVESPNHGVRTVESTPWSAAGPGNPAVTLAWHNDGTNTYTVTKGNNVHAYEDMDNNNLPGYSPDTATLDFNYPFDPEIDPADNVDASITNLFYWNNIIHDIMYQYGFDEVSGNFQNDNLGRGGLGEDYVLAEAQDGGGTNNANFFTPSDGSLPRMQMYLWSPVPETSPLTINSPTSIMGPMEAVESNFSDNNKLEDIGLTTGDLILVEDEGASTHKACSTLSNADSLAGKIAVIDRGECDFVIKVKTVQDLGAIAAIVINNVSGSPITMGGSDNTIVIPAVMVSLSDGDLLKAVMDTAIINASLDSVPIIIPIGDLDNGIITHEYGHGISNRLTGGPSNVSCLGNDEQMGEGWSDYFGLMLATDWATAAATDQRGIGTYVLGQPTNGQGIRTYPYTTDTTENPFTYADIANAPTSGGNPSPHFIGSVWCTMLWDMTWKIIDLVDADPDIYHGTGGNNIALQLVMDALKLQPCNPGFVDGRDAILMADQIRYDGQYACAIWEAFAGRGLGVEADQGSSNNHQDGTESFDKPADIFIASTADTIEMGEGQKVTFTLETTCGCVDQTNLAVEDVLSDEVVYIPGSGGILNGGKVVFNVDTLFAQDSMSFSYSAFIKPCSATEDTVLSFDDAEGPDQYESIKLAGIGNKNWVKSMAQFVSPVNSWYAEDYNALADIALTLISPLTANGPVEIRFDHRYETEATYDGGVVEFSLDGGTTWTDAGPYFTENGYPSAITTTNTDSPIAGQDAFTGNSDTQFDTMGFIQSAIQIYVDSSHPVLVRFRFVCDGGVPGSGINGWYIDDISIQEQSGITNLSRATANGTLKDSLYYGLYTSMFDGSVLYVDQSATGNLGGMTWTDAIQHFPYATELAGCRDADSILVAEGTYLPTLTNDRAISFIIPNNTSVFGAFPAGGGAFIMRDPEQYQTILSGDIGIENDSSDNVYHVVKVDSAQQNILLDGVTINHGNADGIDDNSLGAALFCEGNLQMRDVTISENTGLSDGQVILVRSNTGRLFLYDCTILVPNDNEVKLLNTESAQVRVRGNTVIMEE